MRAATQKRLTAILEADIAKLEAKINHNRFADYEKATVAADQKMLEAIHSKSQVQHAKLILEHDELQKKAKKLWKAVEDGHRDWEKWDEELRALKEDLHHLKYSFAYPIGRYS